jgi:hypothetical protein
MYLKRPNYCVKHFAKALDFRVKVSLFLSRKERKYEKRVTETLNPNSPVPIEEDQVEWEWSFKDLQTEHPQGSRILWVLSVSPTLRVGVVRLREFVADRWLIDHWSKMVLVYETMRKGRKNGKAPQTPYSSRRRRRAISESARKVAEKQRWKDFSGSTDS